MNQLMLDQCDASQYIPLIYTISFLHTVVQERRKFGPLGWNIPYEFNSADWLASCLFVNNYLSDYDPKQGISWPTIRYFKNYCTKLFHSLLLNFYYILINIYSL